MLRLKGHGSVRFSILQEHVQKYVLGGSTLKVDSQLVSDTLFRPVRALIDRGGKAGCFLIQFIFCHLLESASISI